jgi:2-oxoisovalerate dehydrogenase E1 component beta subunit
VVHSATRLVGIGAEISAIITEEAFEWLDAPIYRIGGLDVPVPFSPLLEDAYRPNADKIAHQARALANF